jgi:hypothetical protein
VWFEVSVLCICLSRKMGIFGSKADPSKNAISSKQNHNRGDSQLTLDEGTRERYLQMIGQVSSLDFHVDQFKFTYSRNQDLTKEEFIELCDLNDIPKNKRIGGKGFTITLHCKQDGYVEKRIFFFTRDENNLYNVLCAEASQVSGPNWTALTIAGGVVAGVSFVILLCFTAPLAIAGATAVGTSGVFVGGKYLYDKEQHQFEDAVLGHMIHELEKERVIEFQDSKCYLRSGHRLIAMSDLSS